ncbi:MAG: hypothetical protein WC822_05340 [Candidatus Paceibacterota bacterium]|jgi:hypothetical protein
MKNELSDHDMITKMYLILCGNGSPGLCAQFEDHKKEDREFRRGYYGFKNKLLMGIAYLVGAGVLVGGGFGITKLLGG